VAARQAEDDGARLHELPADPGGALGHDDRAATRLPRLLRRAGRYRLYAMVMLTIRQFAGLFE
jgi:hypothetical protein